MVDVMIDSGSPVNTLTIQAWEQLKRENAIMFNVREKSFKEFRAYATTERLEVISVFSARIIINKNKPEVTAEFFVVKNATQSLLSFNTSIELKVLKVGLSVNTIKEEKIPFPKFPGVVIKLECDKTVTPRKLAYYRVPSAVEKLVEEKLQKMLDEDIIEWVKGEPTEWISPLLVVPKGKNDVRICVDMREPNKAIKRIHHPMPVIETFLPKLRKATCFTRLDISSAYHHVELEVNSRKLTTFMTGKGLMRYKRLMFGLNAAPEMFQKIMEEMLYDIDGVIVYIDDIVVFGKSREEHNTRLELVLKRLKTNNANLNKEKCRWAVSQVEILGFLVDGEGIQPAPSKVEALFNFREPTTKEEVRSFLGLVQFVGHFISSLATRSEPLRMMVRDEVKIFGKKQLEAFNDLRCELTKTVRKLGYFDPNDETQLYTDASPVGLGAVLIQKSGNQPRIISFASKSLTETERKYPQTQREALGVVWGIERFYFYLFGLEFVLFTDHKTLEYIFHGKHQKGKRAVTRAEGWALRLQPYQYKVVHIPGSSNIADSLSRLCNQADKPFDENSEHFLCSVEEILPAISTRLLREKTAEDKEIQEVMKALQTKEWPSELSRYKAFERELGVFNGILVRENRAVMPLSLRHLALNIAHRGHPGAVMMKKILRERTWWPGLDADVSDSLRNCLGCTVVSKEDRPEPMKRKTLPDGPWQQIAIDFLEVRECSTSFLVVVDYYSRYLMVQPVKPTSAENTIKRLEEMFKIWSYPSSITADNGQPFASTAFAKFCEEKGITLVKTIPYWPQMNGEVERQNRGAVRALMIGKVEKKNWKNVMSEYVYAYNIRPHTVTNKAPLELMTGRPVKDLLPTLMINETPDDDNIRESDALAKEKGRVWSDAHRKAKSSAIQVGDTVFAKNQMPGGKLEPNFSPVPYTVETIEGIDATIRNSEGVEYRRCVTHLKKWAGTRDSTDKEFNLTSDSEIGGKDHEKTEPNTIESGGGKKYEEESMVLRRSKRLKL